MRFVSGLATVPVLFLAAMGAESPAVAATFDVVDVAGLRAARLHWGIENGFHRCPDVAFREDAAAIRLRSAAASFALLRRLALNLFWLDKRSGKGLPGKPKATAWNSRYVVDLLNLRLLQVI